MMAHLGLEGLTPMQCKVATAMWMSKPVVPTEAALLALQIPIIYKSRKVVSINSAPSFVRTRRITRAEKVLLAPIDHYMGRPNAEGMEEITFVE